MNNKKYDGVYYPVREVTDLKDILIQSTDMFPDETAYLVKDKELDEFVPITYARVREEMDAFGTRLIDLGLKGKNIAVIGETSYNWILTYFAVVAGVGVIVPLDKNLPQDELLGLVQRSGASALVYSDKSKKNIEPLFAKSFDIERFISIDAEQHTDEALSMSRLITEGIGLMADGDTRYTDAEIDPD
ncbi:MAG: AMP-binding protein, partial [Clostridiales bacterium]|nr:AMP-binding protein [Clostridiales bacterium]